MKLKHTAHLWPFALGLGLVAGCVSDAVDDAGDAGSQEGDGAASGDTGASGDAGAGDDATLGSDGDASVIYEAGPDGACPAETKRCTPGCVALSDPAYGCSPTACSQSVALCGTSTSCIDCTTTVKHATGLTCSGAGACGYTACVAGWLDADGDAKNGCESQSPAGLPEKAYLVGWWIADSNLTGSSIKSWADQSPGATLHTPLCTSACPTYTPSVAALKGHASFTFNGSQFFQINGSYGFDGYGLTWFIVFAPSTTAGSYEPLLDFNVAQSQDSSRLEISHGGADNNILYSVCSSGTCPGWGATMWTAAWHAMVIRHAGTGPAGEAPVYYSDDETTPSTFGFNNASSTVTLPAGQTRTYNYIGLDTFNRYFSGQVAEILVFDASVTPTSQTAIEDYLKNKYGF